MLHLLESITTGATLLLGFLIWSNPRKVNIAANNWLAVFLFSVFFVQLDDLLTVENIYNQYPHLYGISALMVFLIPPSFYLAIVFYTTPGRKLRRADLPHFLLFVIFLLLLMPLLFSSAEAKLQQVNLDKQDEPFEVSSVVIIILFLTQLIVYWALCFAKIIQYQKNIRLYVSSEQPIDLQWLKNFLLCLIGMIMLWIPSLFLTKDWTILISDLGFMFGIFFLSFFTLRQRELFEFNPKETSEIRELIEPYDKTQETAKKHLPEDKVNKIKEQLDELMKAQKPFLNSDLNLPLLASLLDTSSHSLSYVINTAYCKNFFQFVNEHRINEAKSQLVDPKNSHLSVVGIAYNSGFSSKTVFNTFFKKTVGMTPTEYKKMHIGTKSH